METLLRHFVSQATNPLELTEIGELLKADQVAGATFQPNAIHAALNLKKKKLMLGFGEEPGFSVSLSTSSTLVNTGNPPGSTTPREVSKIKAPQLPKPLSYRGLKRKPKDGQNPKMGRELAVFDGKAVLIEWQIVDSSLEPNLKHRIKTLAALLQDMDSPTFHSLSCLGYLKDPVSCNYGFVFQTPPALSEPPIFTSLSSLLSGKSVFPSLNARLSLAISLVETVLQLHTSGWLHKGIRADNVLFFLQKLSKVELKNPFLEGYEYARADNPSDMTEFPILEHEANLYRHPALLKAKRESFRKAHDCYALGCVSIKIGFWRNLTSVLLHFQRHEKTSDESSSRVPTLTYAGKSEMAEMTKEKARLLIHEGLIDTLKFAAGARYTEAVKTCLTAGEESSDAEGKDDEEDVDQDENCIDLELEVLESLRGCTV